MKKLLAVLVVLVCVGATLSALDFPPPQLSAGLGGNFDAAFSTYSVDDPLKPEDYNQHFVGGGFYGFFDATYVEADVGMLFGNSRDDKGNDDKGTDITYLRLALFGKFPFPITDSITLFPMLGIDGLIALNASYDGEKIDDEDGLYADNFNNFWFRLGVGADFNLTEKIYLRPAFLYGIRVNTQGERDTIDDNDKIKAIVGHGLEIRVAVGYRF